MNAVSNNGLQEHVDVEKLRQDFPLLRQKVNAKQLIYADNAATTQKPTCVVERLIKFYEEENSNVHRGVHTLSARGTEFFEGARNYVKTYLNAARTESIIFTRGTTEAINLVAHSYARNILRAGDEVLISELEHHSNIVPWQIVCQQSGALLKVAPIESTGEIDLEKFSSLLNERTKIVAVGHISNALGIINPIKHLITKAHEAGAIVLIDGAQGSIHDNLDVQFLDCDFYAFSGHKALGPTGIGVLYGKENLLESMPPWQLGGDMIKEVTFDKTEFNHLPYKFEAGTPNIAGALGLEAGLRYFSDLNLDAILRHEKKLLKTATERAANIKNLSVYGTAKHKSAILSFNIKGVHPHDLGTFLDHEGIAIRTGHHCAMPLMKKLGLTGTARMSFALYNTVEEVHQVFDSIEKIIPLIEQ